MLDGGATHLCSKELFGKLDVAGGRALFLFLALSLLNNRDKRLGADKA
jgi:hypothetical protein